MRTPETRYLRVDDAFVAYQVFGSGPVDLVVVLGHVSNLEMNWQEPGIARFLQRLGRIGRVVVVDRRGTGLSDRSLPVGVSALETHAGDLLAVMDAARVRSPVVVATEDAARECLLLAAMHPGRVGPLVLYDPLVGALREDASGQEPSVDAWEQELAALPQRWGRGYAQGGCDVVAPSLAGDVEAVERWARYLSLSGTPGSARVLFEQALDSDVTDVLPLVQSPVLVLWREARQGARLELVRPLLEDGREDRRAVVLPGRDLAFWAGDVDRLADEVVAFALGTDAAEVSQERRLTTVLFSDIVGSTERAAALGDREWRDLLRRHHFVVREALRAYGGVEQDTAGDGFYAVFDGPARAVRCALAVVSGVRPLGLEVRVGVHTGECAVLEDKCTGVAVSVGARIAARARPSQVLVSRTVRDLAAGSGLSFEDAGEHEMKGVPDRMQLYGVVER